MLDNMEGDELISVASELKEKWKGKRKFLFESSGNITEDNLQSRIHNGKCCLPPRHIGLTTPNFSHRYLEYQCRSPIRAAHRFQPQDTEARVRVLLDAPSTKSLHSYHYLDKLNSSIAFPPFTPFLSASVHP